MVTAVFCAHELCDTCWLYVCMYVHACVGGCTHISVSVCVWMCHTCVADLCTARSIESRGAGFTSVASSKWVNWMLLLYSVHQACTQVSLCVLVCRTLSDCPFSYFHEHSAGTKRQCMYAFAIMVLLCRILLRNFAWSPDCCGDKMAFKDCFV